jgi:hypothetical protein
MFAIGRRQLGLAPCIAVVAMALAVPMLVGCDSDSGPSSSLPTARWGFGMAYDAARDRALVFGGNSDFDFKGELWEWNPY